MLDFGAEATIVLIVGFLLVLFAATKFFSRAPISYGARGVIAVAGLIIFAGGFYIAASGPVPVSTQQVVSSPSANVINLVGVTGVSSINGMTVNVKATVNTTSQALVLPANGIVKFHFDLYRVDLNTTTASFVVSLGNDIQVANSSKSTSAYLISEYSNNNTVQTTLQTPVATIMGQSIVVILKSAGDEVQVNVTLQLNPQAFLNLVSNNGANGISGIGAYESYVIYAAGQAITVQTTLTGIDH